MTTREFNFFFRNKYIWFSHFHLWGQSESDTRSHGVIGAPSGETIMHIYIKKKKKLTAQPVWWQTSPRQKVHTSETTPKKGSQSPSWSSHRRGLVPASAFSPPTFYWRMWFTPKTNMQSLFLAARHQPWQRELLFAESLAFQKGFNSSTDQGGNTQRSDLEAAPLRRITGVSEVSLSFVWHKATLSDTGVLSIHSWQESLMLR